MALFFQPMPPLMLLYYRYINSLKLSLVQNFSVGLINMVFQVKKDPFNLLYMIPSTIPMLILGFTNRSLMLFTAGIAVLALYVIVGTKQLKHQQKRRE